MQIELNENNNKSDYLKKKKNREKEILKKKYNIYEHENAYMHIYV